MEELYILGLEIFGTFSIVLYILLLIYVAFNFCFAYVNDKKIDLVDKFPKRLMKALDIRDGEILTLAMLAGVMVLIICTIAWPLALVIGTIWGILWILRSLTRTGKRVTKIAKVAHKHLDEVNIEEYKED